MPWLLDREPAEKALVFVMRWVEEDSPSRTTYPSTREMGSWSTSFLEKAGYIVTEGQSVVPTAKAWVWWADWKKGVGRGHE